LFPTLTTRMEEFHDRAGERIDTREVWSFMQVARQTGQRQVREVIASAMLYWEDVLHLELCHRRFRLRALAVFATFPGSLPDEEPRGLLHQEASSRRALAWRVAMKSFAWM